MESLIYELLGEVANASERPIARAGWMGKACDYLRDHTDQAVSLSEVATHVGVDRSHLARVFKGKLGLTVGDYHRGLRTHAAAHQLAGSEIPIARIANEYGFSDQAHMTRVFKDRFGVTPNVYRTCLRRR